MGTTETSVPGSEAVEDHPSEEELSLLRRTARGAFDAGADDLDEVGGLGLLGLLCPVGTDEAGWYPVEAAAVAGEAGRCRDRGGWASAALGAGAVAADARTAGEDRVHGALAGHEPVHWIRATEIDTRTVGSRVIVDATSGPVVGAAGAAAFVVVDGRGAHLLLRRDQPGVVVDAEHDGLDIRGTVRRVRLTGAEAPVLEIPAPAALGLRGAALLTGAAMAAGALGGAVDRLVAYLSERIAFGAPIASFQAIQHRLVDLYVLERKVGAVVAAAAGRLARQSPDALRVSAAAHAFVAERVPPALDECIQLSGGIGLVWEYPLHHELRAAVTDAGLFGTARSSRELLVAAGGA